MLRGLLLSVAVPHGMDVRGRGTKKSEVVQRAWEKCARHGKFTSLRLHLLSEVGTIGPTL